MKYDEISEKLIVTRQHQDVNLSIINPPPTHPCLHKHAPQQVHLPDSVTVCVLHYTQLLKQQGCQVCTVKTSHVCLRTRQLQVVEYYVL